MRIMVVEDEAVLCQQIADFFTDNGFAVDSTGTGTEAYYFAQEYPLDIAVVDLGLPDFSGIKLIERIRSCGITTPILILTARNRWQEKVEGLAAGADDYLSKPFHYQELLARINALLRRSKGNAHPQLQHGNIKLDSLTQQVYLHDSIVSLTAFEYKVLEYLMFRKGETISRSVLAEHIYTEDLDPDSNVIDVFVARLRKKLDPSGNNKPITTIRGRGYLIADEQLAK